MLLLGLFLLFVLLFVIPFSVEFSMLTEGLDITPRVKFGIGNFLLTLPQGMLTSISSRIRKRRFTTREAAWRGLKSGLRFLDSLAQQVSLLHLEVSIGTGDPFWTALGVGGLWAMISPLLTGLSCGHRLRTEPQIRFQPDYGEAQLRVFLHCIFQFRLGQIIVNELKRVMM